MNIADLIRTRRASLNLSQAALADAIGTTQGRVGDWERGDRKPGIEWLEKLAAVLGPITIGDAMGELIEKIRAAKNGGVLIPYKDDYAAREIIANLGGKHRPGSDGYYDFPSFSIWVKNV